MEDAQVALIQRLSEDLEPPAGPPGKLYEHPEWRDMAAVVALILMDRRRLDRRDLEFRPDDEGVHEDHYPIAEVQSELKEQWGVEVHREALRRFIRSSVEPLLVNSEVGSSPQWHRRMVLRAHERMDTVARSVELAALAEDLARELIGKRGEVHVEDGKTTILVSNQDVARALKEARMSNREAHEMLASIGWAPPIAPKGGHTVNTNVNVAFDPAALGGIGTRPRPIDAERV